MLRTVSVFVLVLVLMLGSTACAHAPSAASPRAPDVALVAADGASERLAERVARSPYTVLVFFSSDCPVQKVHDARLRDLAKDYGARGVTFTLVSADVDAKLEVENEAARARGLPTPVLADRGAALADGAGVDYSTHALLVDRGGSILYSGALDSDRARLTDGASLYLKSALDAALAGSPVAIGRTEALGCPLRKR